MAILQHIRTTLLVSWLYANAALSSRTMSKRVARIEVHCWDQPNLSKRRRFSLLKVKSGGN